jgi:hypothetical protein
MGETPYLNLLAGLYLPGGQLVNYLIHPVHTIRIDFAHYEVYNFHTLNWFLWRTISQVACRIS